MNQVISDKDGEPYASLEPFHQRKCILPSTVPIGLASNLTGVSASTIRAWERRYGVPTPMRAENGRRNYNPQALSQIRLMSRLVSNGLPASLAAKRVLAGLPPADLAVGAKAPQADEVPLESILNAVSTFDADDLSQQLRRLALALPTHDFFDRVIVPLMVTLNSRWLSAKPIDRVQEYLATETIRRLMHELCRMVRPSLARGSVLIAPFYNDIHVLPLDALAFLFNGKGYSTLQLGPMTAPSAIAEVIQATKPNLVALSMTNQVPEKELRILLSEYENACGNVPWIIGGSAAHSARSLIAKTGGTLVPDGRALDRYLESFVV